MDVYELIKAQQKGKENTTVFVVGQQLKDICRADPHCAQLVAADLANGAMSIEACEKKIKAYADELHKKQNGNSVGVSPIDAERIIREFYGLPGASEQQAVPVLPVDTAGSPMIDLLDFL